MFGRRRRIHVDHGPGTPLTINTVAGPAAVLAYEFTSKLRGMLAFASYKDATRREPTLFSAFTGPPAAFAPTLLVLDHADRVGQLHARVLPFVAQAGGVPATPVRAVAPTLIAMSWASAVLRVPAELELVAAADRVLTDPDGSAPAIVVA